MKKIGNIAEYMESGAKKQVNKLYLLTAFESFSLGGANWVALLALRGFSLTQIGILEAIFHVVSLCAEIPSGAVADVLGRKKTLIVSRIVSVLSAFAMIVSQSFGMVAIAIGICALSYNLASGTREALAYDSLKAKGCEDSYNKYAANDMMIYRIGSGVSTLLAGLALYLGFKKAYFTDTFIGLAALLIAVTLFDYSVKKKEHNNIFKQVVRCITDSLAFLKKNPKAIAIIVINSIVGSIATLLLFFLQAKLPEIGLPQMLLGPALFIMTLGAALGAKVVQYCENLKFKAIVMVGCSGVIIALLTLILRNPYVVVIGGFIASFSDDFMQVRADVLMNGMIPSEQRATLLSVCSFAFSVVMIILSPIMGYLLELI